MKSKIEGFALIGVLQFFVLICLLITGLLMINSIRLRFISREKDKIQSRYNAESAVNLLIDSLETKVPNVSKSSLTLPWGDVCDYQLINHGLFNKIIVTGYKNKSSSKLKAYLGIKPEGDLNSAIYIGDGSSFLTLSGTSVLKGPIITGERGYQILPFKGKSFSGTIEGENRKIPNIKLPEMNQKKIQDIFTYAENIIKTKNDFEVFFSDKDIIFNKDQIISNKNTYISSKNIIFNEGSNYKEGCIFIAGEKIILNGNILGRYGIFIGLQNVEINNSVCNGQFFAKREIVLKKQSELKYPSVICLYNSLLDYSGQVVIQDSSIVEGTVIVSLEKENDKHQPELILGKDSVINGLIYNNKKTQLNDCMINGTLITNQLYFYISPSHYINWMINSKIDFSQRRKNMIIPDFLTDYNKMEILQIYEEK